MGWNLSTKQSVDGNSGWLALLHPDLPARRQEYAHAFRQAQPFPHVVVDNFFAPEICDQILRDFPPFEQGCALNESGLLGNKAVVDNVRDLGPVFQQVDDLMRSSEFLQLISNITGIPDLLYDPAYIGGGTHENRGTQELDAHVDFNYHPRQGWHRRLNLIVYLNPEWQESWGGCLELHRNPWLPEQDEVKSIVPLKNRCVFFETSERSWHGFRRLTLPPGKQGLSRRSFAVYLYTRERPAAEVAPPHATVYVERPLPACVRAGATLTAKEIDTIRSMIDRRSQHLARLFKREQQFIGVINNILYQLLVKGGGQLQAEDVDALQGLVQRQDQLLKELYDREKFLTALAGTVEDLRNKRELRLPLIGELEQVGEAEGYWEDQWATTILQFKCQVHQPVRTLRLHGFVPSELKDGQEFAVTVNGTSWRRRVNAGHFAWNIAAPLAAGEEADVRIDAARSWNPSKAGTSTDARDLAFSLSEICLA